MLKRNFFCFTIIGLIFILILGSCTNTKLQWRQGYLIAQLYRQPHQKILMAYNDFSSEMIVDEQSDYSRAYFDKYRKQMIFQKEGQLNYLIDGKEMTTATDEISGYTSQVLFNDKYQVGVEILDIKNGSLGEGQFWGTKSRIIDLHTKQNIILDGLLFNTNMLAGDYFYGFTFSKTDAEVESEEEQESEDVERYLDIIDLRTMEHKRFNTTEQEISFLYQKGDKVYGQSDAKKTAFVFDRLNMQEQKTKYNDKLLVDKSEWPILKDIAPLNSNQHWYITPVKEYDTVMQAKLMQLSNNDIKEVMLDFQRDDVIQIMDVANYGTEYVALFLTTKDDDGTLHAIITVFDLYGKEVHRKEITEIRTNDYGRFTYLDYVE